MKKTVIFALAVVVFVLGFVGCAENENRNDDSTTTTTKVVSTTKGAESFDEAFSMRGLSYSPYEFSSSGSCAFVGLETDDTLELLEFGYEGDTVKEAVKTFYLNVEQYDAAQRESIKQSMESNFAEAGNIGGVTVTHTLTDRYYVMKAEMKALDNADTLKAVCDAGLFDFVSGEFSTLSVSVVEDTLISKDFIKR